MNTTRSRSSLRTPQGFLTKSCCLLLAIATFARLGLGAGLAAPAEKPTLFVAPLHGDPTLGPLQPAVGDGLAEMCVTELIKLDTFRVLESTTLDKIKDEIKMGEDGWIEPAEKVAKGHWRGADFMFVAKITRFGGKEREIGASGISHLPIRLPLPVRRINVALNEAEVQIVWRILDATSREAICGGTADGKETGASWSMGGAFNEGFFREKEFQNSALGKATVKALNQVMADVARVRPPASRRAAVAAEKTMNDATSRTNAEAKLRETPGVVQAVTDKFLVVSLGAGQGFKPGDKLHLYSRSDVSNKLGQVVMTLSELVGEITLETVTQEKSTARYEGKCVVQEGWTVKSPATFVRSN